MSYIVQPPADGGGGGPSSVPSYDDLYALGLSDGDYGTSEVDGETYRYHPGIGAPVWTEWYGKPLAQTSTGGDVIMLPSDDIAGLVARGLTNKDGVLTKVSGGPLTGGASTAESHLYAGNVVWSSERIGVFLRYYTRGPTAGFHPAFLARMNPVDLGGGTRLWGAVRLRSLAGGLSQCAMWSGYSGPDRGGGMSEQHASGSVVTLMAEIDFSRPDGSSRGRVADDAGGYTFGCERHEFASTAFSLLTGLHTNVANSADYLHWGVVCL